MGGASTHEVVSGGWGYPACACMQAIECGTPYTVCPRGAMAERSKLLESRQPPSLRHLTSKDYGKLKSTQRKVNLTITCK